LPFYIIRWHNGFCSQPQPVSCGGGSKKGNITTDMIINYIFTAKCKQAKGGAAERNVKRGLREKGKGQPSTRLKYMMISFPRRFSDGLCFCLLDGWKKQKRQNELEIRQ